MLRVLLVDDEPLVRASLRAMRNWEEDGFTLNGDASNGLEALDVLGKGETDIVLLDMHMPRCDGIEVLKKMAESGLSPAVAVLSAYDEFSLVREAFTLGACDYILKADMSGERVLDVLNRAAEKLANHRIKTVEEPRRRSDERLRQQILRDLLHGRAPNSLYPILKDLDVPLGFPLIPCEFRPVLPEVPEKDGKAGRRRADTVLQYIRNVLESRQSGQYVFLSNRRAAWLAFCAEDDMHEGKAKTEDVARELVELTRQTLNIHVDWAAGEWVESLDVLSQAFRNMEGLFHPNSRPIRRAKAYIRKHYGNPELSLADTARNAGISRTHLSSLFSKECREGFGEYLTKVRIEEARRLLEETELKVYEIAERVGYRSTEHFSRTFKKITGTTPNRYQRQVEEYRGPDAHNP